MAPRYDAFVLVSFGGPEGPDDVIHRGDLPGASAEAVVLDDGVQLLVHGLHRDLGLGGGKHVDCTATLAS